MNNFFSNIKKIKIKNIKYSLFIALFIIFIILYYILDLGFNSGPFIKRGLSRAFIFAQTNQCEKFLKYVEYKNNGVYNFKNQEDAIDLCEDINQNQFTKFRVTAYSHDLFSKEAYVQVSFSGGDNSEDVENFILRKTFLRWKIKKF